MARTPRNAESPGRKAAGWAVRPGYRWALAGLVHQCTLWIPGHFDRAADRKYKEAAKGQRGRSKANPVEATIRMLMSDAHNSRNVNTPVT